MQIRETTRFINTGFSQKCWLFQHKENGLVGLESVAEMFPAQNGSWLMRQLLSPIYVFQNFPLHWFFLLFSFFLRFAMKYV